jgi:hypothetical protein
MRAIVRPVHSILCAALSLCSALAVASPAAAQPPPSGAEPAVPPSAAPAPTSPTAADALPAAPPEGIAPPSNPPAAASAEAEKTPDAPSATTPPDAPVEKAQAPKPIPWNRLYLGSLTVIRYNPLGLETQNRLVFQRRLMDSESLLFRDTFVSGAASLKLNPAFLKVGPTIELQPIAVLNVRAGYEFLRYFGTFGFLQSYPDPSADYADSARKKTEDMAYSTSGHHVFIEPTLQVKVKSVALRSKLAVEYWNMDVTDGTRVFYDATLDTQVPAKGWVLANDTDLVYLAGRLTLGARFSGVWPLYTSDHFGPAGEPADFAGASHLRVGPLVAFSFNTDEYTGFNKPTLLAVVNWYLDHPNREGGVPYILLGFSFTSDFLSAK